MPLDYPWYSTSTTDCDVPAVNGYFFIPNYGTIVAAINFDRTGTTGIGKYVLNHSFMIPGLIATFTSIGIGMLLISIMF